MNFLFILLGISLPAINGVIQNSPFTSNGLIFKPVADVYKYKEMRNVMTSIPQSYLKTQQANMATHISDLEELQKRMKNSDSFSAVVVEIKRLADALDEISNLITENSNYTTKTSDFTTKASNLTTKAYNFTTKTERKRRAILPFMGTFIQWAFGNPDEETKEEILELIRMNTVYQQHTDRLVYEHTIFIKSLTESIKMKNRLINDEISNIITTLNSTLSRFNIEANQIELQNELNIYVQVLTLHIVRYKSYQDKLLMHILSEGPIHIDPEIIPLSYLSPVISQMEKDLPHDQMLPFNLIQNKTTIDWYKSIPMQTSIVHKNIVFEFFIPVVARQKRVLLEVISAPFPKEGYLVYIQPQAQYILTNDIYTEISYLAQSDIDSCWKMNANKDFVCPSNLPIFNMLPQNNYCELTLLLQASDVSHNCEFKILPKKDLFVKIHHSDQYYYVLTKEMNFTTRCGKDIEKVSLNGTGFITVNDSCSMYNQFLRIESQSTTKLYKELNVIKNTFVPLALKKSDKNKFIVNNKDLYDMSKEFERLKERLQYNVTFNNLSAAADWKQYYKTAKIHSGINISTSVVIFLIIAICIGFLYEFRANKETTPISVATYIAEERIDQGIPAQKKPLMQESIQIEKQ